ncbi:MAG: diguanylate cyclase [Deltaproteobacteria bacterium]|nr:diguanylate cyclase [Deltaproteobacteria bacterium]
MTKNNFLKFTIPFLILFLISAIILRAFFVDTLPALSIAAVLSLSFFAAYLYYLITKERNLRSRLEGRLSAIETSAREMQNNGGDAAFTAVSREEKERVSFDSAFKATDSISGTLALLKKILNCHNCVLVDIGEKRHTLIAAASPDIDTQYELPKESAESLVAWIAEHRVPLRIGRVRDWKGLSYYTSDKGVNSFLGVPVFEQGDKLKAILCVDSKENEAFGQEAERLLFFAAHNISEFLKNASHLSRMKTEAAEFAAFYRLSKRLSSTLNIDEILDIAAASSKEIVDYDMACFLLMQDSETLKVAAAKGFKAAELLNKTFHRDLSLAGWVIKNGKPLSFTDFRDDKRDTPIFPGQHLPMRSLACLPLSMPVPLGIKTGKDDTFGVFLMASRKEDFFSPYETKIFEVIAAHTATHIANARMYQQAEKMATTDGLTGLFNHRYFQERLAAELERGERYKQKLSLVLVDIDHFKKVNDTHGHPAGDKILKEVAKILTSTVRTVDVAARYGGEEFAIILVNTDGKGALETAERIRKIMESGKFNIGDGTAIKITGSMGIAVFPDDTGLEEGSQRLLISKTDSALYLAKKEGRNMVYLFKDVAERIEKKQETSKHG